MARKKKITISDDTITDFLDPWRDSSKNYQSERSVNRRKWYRAMRGMPYGNERQGMSTAVRQVIWEVVQGMIPGLIEIFTDDFFSLTSDNFDRADKFKKLIKYQMFVKQDGESQLDSWIQDCLMYEMGVLKVCHRNDYDIEEIKFDELTDQDMSAIMQDPMLIPTKYETVELFEPGMLEPVGVVYRNVKVVKKIPQYIGPSMESIPPWEFYISPEATSVDDALYVAHWVKRNLDYVKKRESAGLYRKGSTEKVKEKISYGQEDMTAVLDEIYVRYEADEVEEPDYLIHETRTDAKEITPNAEVWIKEEYVRLDLDGDGLLEPALVVSCNGVVLNVDYNPYKRPPFRIGRVLPEPHKLTGISIPQLLYDDQKVQTNLLRLMQDAAAFAAWKNPITNDPQMIAALDRRRPFDTIQADPNKVEWLEAPQVGNSIFKAMEFEDTLIENKTGVTKYNQGLDSNSLNKTATGINIIANMAQQKQKLCARRLGRDLKHVIRDFIFINQMYPPQDAVKLLGQDIEVRQDDLYGEYDITDNVGVGPQERSFVAEQILGFVQMAMKSNLMQMGIVTPDKIREALLYIGQMQSVPYERFVISEQELQRNAFSKIQQMGQQMQMLSGENQGLKKAIEEIRGQILQMPQSQRQAAMMLPKAEDSVPVAGNGMPMPQPNARR